MTIAQRLAGHKAALQFSGGKDSMACLYLLRDHLEDIAVYWMNPGDEYPETRDVIDQVRAWIPHFVEITGDVKSWKMKNGYPTDIMPTNCTPFAVGLGESDLMLTDRLYCCNQNIMLPLHQRMAEDGITLIIRGQKDLDKLRGDARDGQKIGDFEFFYPIQDWSDIAVHLYLEEVGAPVSRVYEMLEGAPDCFTCSAWWSEGRGEYLEKYHPEEHENYRGRLRMIGERIHPHMLYLLQEIGD